MTGTWKGIGTKFYGSSDQDDDDSFITTEWFVFLFLPIDSAWVLSGNFGGTRRGCSGSASHYLI